MKFRPNLRMLKPPSLHFEKNFCRNFWLTKGNTVLIIDAKYYTQTMQSHYNVRKLHSGNLYQLFTYVKNKDKDKKFGNQPHTVSGMLLYAKTDEGLQPCDEKYVMGNNMIIVRTLDLNREFNEIANNLRDIAKKYVYPV